MSFLLPEHSLCPYGSLLLWGICCEDWWRREAAGGGRGGACSEITSCFFLPFVYVFERECLRDFELFLRGSRSLSTKHPVCWLHHWSESPASVLLWLAPSYRRDRERERGKKRERERVRQCYSLSMLTLCEAKSERPGREENASTPLTTLTPAPHSKLNRHVHPLFSGSCLTRNYWSSIVDWTTLSWPWGWWCFLSCGGMFWQELAQKIRGYQEQIASLHSKCKMLTVKAKHATMLLTVSEVEGLSDGMDELSDEELPGAGAITPPSNKLPAHPSVVMVSGKAFCGRNHPQTHTCTYCMAVWSMFMWSVRMCSIYHLSFLSRRLVVRVEYIEPKGVLLGFPKGVHG